MKVCLVMKEVIFLFVFVFLSQLKECKLVRLKLGCDNNLDFYWDNNKQTWAR